MTGQTSPVNLVKCVVWDLDNTLWDGVLLEDGAVRLRREMAEAIVALDQRGILQSIASRNDAETAMAELTRLGLADYFLYPQIHWGSKAASVRAIASALRFSENTIAFIDDQPFERDEVRSVCPDVVVLDPDSVPAFLRAPATNPPSLSATARQRRHLYRAEIERARDEAAHEGPNHAFLETLGLVLSMQPATLDDLDRLDELTARTSQLNSMGRVYSHDELRALIDSPRHVLLTAALEDRYGSYGTIGLAVVERDAAAWTIRLIVVSCRVMSRGVGGLIVSHLLERGRRAGVAVRADFKPTSRNRVMFVTFRFAGFREVEACAGGTLLEHAGAVPPIPSYVTLKTADMGIHA